MKKASELERLSAGRPRTKSLRERGVAILMVMVVLTGLLALAAPFVFSMVQHGRTARSDLNQARAEAGSRAAVDHAFAHLCRNLIKFKDPSRRVVAFDPTPDWDTTDELKVDMTLPDGAISVTDPNGLFWSAKVEDEQGKINLHSASPALFGNLLGSAVLTEPAGSAATELTVDDASAFASDGDPTTVDGTICVGINDPVPYLHVSGNRITLGGSLPAQYGKMPKGTLVYDGRARQLLDYSYPGVTEFRPFRSLYEVKSVGGFRQDEFARIERYITIYSERGGPEWGRGQLNLATNLSSTSWGLPVENPTGFGPGTRIRTIQKGIPQQYDLVANVQLNRGTGPSYLGFTHPIGVDVQGSGVGNEISVEHQLRHPININTAPPEVLEACVKGLVLATGGNAIDGPMAKHLAAFLSSGGRVYRDDKDLLDALRLFQQQMSAQGVPFTGDMRDAVYINATEPNSYRVRMPTTTFCYKSLGSFTIIGTGAVNADNGLQLARSEIKQVITLPGPPPGDLLIQTQTDFQKRLDEGNGARLTTWPVPMPPTNKGRRQGFTKEPDTNPKTGTNDIRLNGGICGEDAVNVIEKPLVEHCDDYKNIAFFQDGYNLSKGGAEAFHYPGLHQNPGGAPVGRRGRNGGGGAGGWMSPGGMEAWIKPGAANDFYLYDQGNSDSQTRNRVSFYYDSSKPGLVIRIFDANLQNKFVEYVYPAKLDANEWYHVAGSWHASTHNGMEARIDANPISREGEIRFRPACKLSGGCAEKATSVTVEAPEDATDFDQHYPSQGGAIRIGQEIIEYESRNGYNFVNCRRGTRLSAAIDHVSGEMVQPYGYAARVCKDRPIIRGGGQLTERLEVNVQTTVSKPPPQPPVTETDDVLPVVSAVKFPSSGYIEVNGEVMFYGAKTASSLSKIQRAQEGTSARQHAHGVTVKLCSLMVSNANGYSPYIQADAYNGQTFDNLVQIEDSTNSNNVEWIMYEGIRQGKYLLAKFNNAVGLNTGRNGGIGEAPTQGTDPITGKPMYSRRVANWRGCKLTTEVDHIAKAKVIPVQTMAGPWMGDMSSPKGVTMNDDVSTHSIVLKGQSDGELRFVKRAYIFQYARVTSYNASGTASYTDNAYECRNNFNILRAAQNNKSLNSWGFEFLVAFDDFTQRDYPAEDVRVIRWPSGEMPDSDSSDRKLFTDITGQGRFEGKIDEVKTLALRGRGAVIAGLASGFDINTPNSAKLDGLLSGARTMFVELPTAWPIALSANCGYYNYSQDLRLEQQGVPDFNTNGGLIKVDDELIFYKTATPVNSSTYLVDTRPSYSDKSTEFEKLKRIPLSVAGGRQLYQLSGLSRGVLNTSDSDHTPGAALITYEAMPVSLLTGSINSTADEFSLINAAGFSPEGYAWIDDEVVAYQSRAGNSFKGCQPFRGRYGTSGSEHPSNSVVRSLPFRYWDRCPFEYDGTGQAFFQTGHSEENTLWDSFTLKIMAADAPSIPNGLQPVTVVRFDGKPNWNMTPTNKPGGLFLYQGSGNFGLGGTLADRMEMRVYWQYRPGAFQPNTDWKRNFGVDEISAIYHHPLKIHRVEQIEKR